MSYSKLIHEYLDGELTSVEQDVLFNELAQNHELRFEFNQQVKLQIIAQSDMGTITPPAASTNAIFAALGFAIPSREYVQSISGKDAAGTNFGYSNFIRRIFARYAGTITAILIAVLSTATVFIVSDNFFGSSSDSAGNGKNSGNTKISGKSNIPNSSIPMVSSVASDENSSGTQTGSENGTQTGNENLTSRSNGAGQNNANAARDAFSSDSRRNRANNGVTVAYGRNSGRNATAGRNTSSGRNTSGVVNNLDEEQSDVQPLSLASADIVNSSGEASQRFASRFSNLPISPGGPVMLSLNIPETSISSFKERDWMINVRNLPSNSSISVNLPSASLNMGFSGMYKLDDNNMLGLEIGVENFGLKYSTVEEGKRWNEGMTPPLLCYGLTWRVNMTELGYEDIIFPYAQIFAGGTIVGPLGRAQLGLQFNPFGMLALSLGIEGSSLWYNVQGDIYHTEKYGISVGGGIKF